MSATERLWREAALRISQNERQPRQRKYERKEEEYGEIIIHI